MRNLLEQYPATEADLFTPGRGSFPVENLTDPSGFQLELTEASIARGIVAAQVFDPTRHAKAVFAGGYPGLAQAKNWPNLADGTPYLPASDQREANQMMQPLVDRLRSAHWSEAGITERVKAQGDSSNSIDDVLRSIQKGYLTTTTTKTTNTA